MQNIATLFIRELAKSRWVHSALHRCFELMLHIGLQGLACKQLNIQKNSWHIRCYQEVYQISYCITTLLKVSHQKRSL